jgi:TonB family protein
MSSYLNYLIESNIALILFFVVYLLLLRNETDFRIKRGFLLVGLVASILFPLLHIQSLDTAIPSLHNFFPTYLLPEVSISAEGVSQQTTMTSQGSDIWNFFRYLYLAGAVVLLVIFVVQILGLVSIINNSHPVQVGKFKIVESTGNKPPFSFFNFIFLGQASTLSSAEKEKVIRHEMVHARQLHSFDIVLVTLSAIVFWFNPIIRLYKKAFIQLHEFEADARAVDDNEVNEYCALLAKVALMSADIRLASHFSSSLTIKRINMMRTLKQKIKMWKLIAVTGTIPLIFFVVACQDQVMTEVQDLAKTTNMAVDIPDVVQRKIDEIKEAGPGKNYVVIETTDERGWSTLEKIKQSDIATIELITPTAGPSEPTRTFAIVELNQNTSKMSTLSVQENNVYTVVDDTATPVGGIPVFYEYVASNMLYPKAAREKGIEGKVFIEFTIQEDGTLTDHKILKGVAEDLNQEALRVLQSAPRWTPGKVKGKAVKQRMVMPISFSLGRPDTE